jgi:hypothetical protein
VDGPAALRDAILGRPAAFATILTERLMTYALGRGVEPSDMPVVRRIVRQAGQRNYALQSIIAGIVESMPFQMRTKLDPAPDTSNRVALQGTPVQGTPSTRNAAEAFRQTGRSGSPAVPDRTQQP